MKIKIGQHAIQQERQTIERERAIADFELDFRFLGTVNLLGLEGADVGDRLANALDQFGKRRFIILEFRRLHPGQSRRAAHGRVRGDPNLA